MTKVTKALLVAFGSAGLVGTGFAAWNITISGGTSANRTVTPNTDGDVVLVARGLLVSDVATSLTFHADTGTQVATYNVKAEDSDWYDNVDLLDASEEKVSLKVSFAGDSDTHEWSNYIALTEAVERTYSPSEWLEGKSSSGLDVSFTFNWVGLGVYANPKAYAQATYPTVESQQAYLEAVSAAIEGLQFTFSFDLVANEPVTPPSPSVESVSASLSSASIEVGQTSTLTVNTNLANNVSGYSIVEDSGIPAVASFENGVFTGVSAGEVRFKVEIDSVKSSEVVLTVTAASPVDEVLGIVIDQAKTDPTELEVGDDMTLTTTISKTGDPAISLSWVSSDEDVIMVDDGYVLAAEAGTATVTVTETNSDKSASIVFSVSEPAPVASITSVSVSPSEAEIEVGGNTTLTASVVKVGEISEAVTWSSDAEGVATVENGVVTGVAAGTAHITATSVADGTKSGSATITVVAATPVINYGTAESPLDASTALSTIQGLSLASGSYSAEKFYVRGKVSTVPQASQYNSVDQVSFDLEAGSNVLTVFKANLASQQAAPYQNDMVTVYGYAKNHGGTLEITYQGSDNPSLSNIVAGTSTITVTPNHSTVTGIPATETNGEVVEFTVAADDGYTISSVKANNVTLTADNGTYSFTVAGNMSVVVTTAESGQQSVEPIEFTFNSTNNSQGVSSYTATWTNLGGDGATTLTLNGWNNNNNGWDYIKAGRKGNAAEASMVLGPISDKVTSIVVSVTTLPNGKNALNHAYLYVSSSASFDGENDPDPIDYLDDMAANTEVSFDVPSASQGANLYYKILFDIKSASSNGPLAVDQVTVNF